MIFADQFNEDLKFIRNYTKKNNVANKFLNESKFINYSLPYSLADQFGIFAVQSAKVKYIEKHKFPGTNIYNIKSLLDDENLYTIQIKDMVSGIKKYIYLDPETAMKRNPKYSKDRVYEFVASTSVQIPLMLKGKRMDCAPRSSGKGNVVT